MQYCKLIDIQFIAISKNGVIHDKVFIVNTLWKNAGSWYNFLQHCHPTSMNHFCGYLCTIIITPHSILVGAFLRVEAALFLDIWHIFMHGRCMPEWSAFEIQSVEVKHMLWPHSVAASPGGGVTSAIDPDLKRNRLPAGSILRGQRQVVVWTHISLSQLHFPQPCSLCCSLKDMRILVMTPNFM